MKRPPKNFEEAKQATINRWEAVVERLLKADYALSEYTCGLCAFYEECRQCEGIDVCKELYHSYVTAYITALEKAQRILSLAENLKQGVISRGETET